MSRKRSGRPPHRLAKEETQAARCAGALTYWLARNEGLDDEQAIEVVAGAAYKSSSWLRKACAAFRDHAYVAMIRDSKITRQEFSAIARKEKVRRIEEYAAALEGERLKKLSEAAALRR